MIIGRIFLLISLTNFVFGQEKIHPDDTLKNNIKEWYWHPIAGSGPETGLQLGAGFFYHLKEADSSRRTSFVIGNLTVTLKKYWASGFSIRYFTPGEQYLLQGDVSYINLPLYFYGIGNDIDPDRKELYFSKSLRVHIAGYRKIAKNIFVGAGYQFGSLHDMSVPENGILESLDLYGVDGHYFSGPLATVLYDSRDNQLASTRGWFVKLSNGAFLKFLGSKYEFNALTVDVRTFLKPFHDKEDVLAVHFLGMTTAGEVPFTEMALMGSQSIMRGYYSGQYRDKNLLALQVEYRYHVNHWLGIVGFAGAGAVMRELTSEVGNVKPSYGGGIRFRMPAIKNLNLRIDYGKGREAGNFYIGLMEAF